MIAKWIKVRVKPEKRQDFLEAIEVDALGSERDEPGCVRFNVGQNMMTRRTLAITIVSLLVLLLASFLVSRQRTNDTECHSHKGNGHYRTGSNISGTPVASHAEPSKSATRQARERLHDRERLNEKLGLWKWQAPGF